jgi:hypothetical protein
MGVGIGKGLGKLSGKTIGGKSVREPLKYSTTKK